MIRDYQLKLQSGEYIYTWNGFSPFYAGCFYGDSICLGGEEKYRQCYGFFSGIGDVEWWVVEELEKLTQEEKDELLHILKRNKEFDEYKNSIVPELAGALRVEKYQVYRIPNKTLYEFVNVVRSLSNDAIAEKNKKQQEERQKKYAKEQDDLSDFLKMINSDDFSYKQFD